MVCHLQLKHHYEEVDKNESRYSTWMITFSNLDYEAMTFILYWMSKWAITDYNYFTRPWPMAYSLMIKIYINAWVVVPIPESKTLVQQASLWLTRKTTLKVSRKLLSTDASQVLSSYFTEAHGEERNVEIARCHEFILVTNIIVFIPFMFCGVFRVNEHNLWHICEYNILKQHQQNSRQEEE